MKYLKRAGLIAFFPVMFVLLTVAMWIASPFGAWKWAAEFFADRWDGE